MNLINNVNKDDETSTRDLDVPNESHLLVDQVNTAFTHGELNELLQVCFVRCPSHSEWCKRYERLKVRELRPLIKSWLDDPKHLLLLDQMSNDQILGVFI